MNNSTEFIITNQKKNLRKLNNTQQKFDITNYRASSICYVYTRKWSMEQHNIVPVNNTSNWRLAVF